jgi:hypothetical protein
VLKGFRDKVSAFRIHEESFGVMGMKNKACIINTFNIHDSSFAFCANHLPSGAGEKKVEKRIECLEEVYHKHLAPENYDYIFFYGDLNTRNTITLADALPRLQKLYNGDLETMKYFLDRDELMTMKSNPNRFYEPKINFKPTYRYVRGKPQYSDVRIPAWTDRI